MGLSKAGKGLDGCVFLENAHRQQQTKYTDSETACPLVSFTQTFSFADEKLSSLKMKDNLFKIEILQVSGI